MGGQSSEIVLKIIWTALAMIVTIPSLFILAKASMFIGAIGKTVDVLQKAGERASEALQDFSNKTDERFKTLESRQDDHHEKISILWDGHERRTGGDRRSGE